jgi:nucleoredoxin
MSKKKEELILFLAFLFATFHYLGTYANYNNPCLTIMKKIIPLTLAIASTLLLSGLSAAEKAKGSSSSSSASSASDLFDGPLLDAKGTEVSKEALAGKTIGLYFSAHWCPPCRSFTPKLVKFRDANKKDFEVVFVSSDRSPKAQMAYMKETGMKWYTLPHRSSAANALAKKHGIRGIPALIIVSPDGKTITKNGRNDVISNAKGALKAWGKKSS